MLTLVPLDSRSVYTLYRIFNSFSFRNRFDAGAKLPKFLKQYFKILATLWPYVSDTCEQQYLDILGAICSEVLVTQNGTSLEWTKLPSKLILEVNWDKKRIARVLKCSTFDFFSKSLLWYGNNIWWCKTRFSTILNVSV